MFKVFSISKYVSIKYKKIYFLTKYYVFKIFPSKGTFTILNYNRIFRLMKSGINPFDSQEAKPYKNDPEILAMTNLVVSYQNNDINQFELILKQNRNNIMDDPFIREHIEDLLRNIRTQVKNLHNKIEFGIEMFNRKKNYLINFIYIIIFFFLLGSY